MKEILTRFRVIAVVGLSRERSKQSYKVAGYLKRNGFRIVPINPLADEILGEKAYRNLLEMPAEVQKTVEVVDVFRPSEEVLPVVEQAIELSLKYGRLKVVWMQLGIVDKKAAKKAEKAGLIVVMDRCMKQEHERLLGNAEDWKISSENSGTSDGAS